MIISRHHGFFSDCSLKTSWILFRTNHVTAPSLAFTIRVKFIGNKQKGESQNGGNKKTTYVNFFEKRIFLTPWY